MPFTPFNVPFSNHKKVTECWFLCRRSHWHSGGGVGKAWGSCPPNPPLFYIYYFLMYKFRTSMFGGPESKFLATPMAGSSVCVGPGAL